MHGQQPSLDQRNSAGYLCACAESAGLGADERSGHCRKCGGDLRWRREGDRVRGTVPSVPAAVSEARARLDDELRRAGVDPARRHEAVLALSEVVSNAIAHGSRSDDRIEIAWTIRGNRLQATVRDRARAAGGPVLLGGDTTRESGRGLRVLDRLTESWGERIVQGHREVGFSLALD